MNENADTEVTGNNTFDVAISFAGAERSYALVVAKILVDNGLRIFLDEFHTSELWGTNLVEQLRDIYENKAAYCLIFVSREYCEKVYTNVERRSALDRAIHTKTDYILPLLVDDSWIQGLSKSTAYLDLRKHSFIAVCEAVYRKFHDQVPADGLAIPEDVDLYAHELGAPKTTEKQKYAVLASVRECFDQYRTALLHDKGKLALRLVSESTIEYYGRVRDLALYGRAKELRDQSLMTQLVVLLLRHRLDADQLAAMTPADLFVATVDQGMTGKSDMSALRVKRIKMERPDIAFAEIAVGASAGMYIRFVKEKNKWRLDVLSLLQIAEVANQAWREQQGFEDAQYLAMAIETLTHKKLTKKSWEPLIAHPQS